jgi:hypothetical protein
MDNEYGLDLREIRKLIDTADVFIVRFALTERRLLVDMRTNDLDRPMLKLVQRARSMEERIESLQRLRPRFALPEQLMSFWWPRRIEALEASGIWQHLLDRLASLGDPPAIEQAREVYRELLQDERAEIFKAIRGEGYQALWEVTA